MFEEIINKLKKLLKCPNKEAHEDVNVTVTDTECDDKKRKNTNDDGGDDGGIEFTFLLDKIRHASTEQAIHDARIWFERESGKEIDQLQDKQVEEYDRVEREAIKRVTQKNIRDFLKNRSDEKGVTLDEKYTPIVKKECENDMQL